MLFSNISIVDELFNVKENQYVLVEENIIKYIGNEKPNVKYDLEYDGQGKLLLPGFYNTHAHTPMTLLRGYGENLSLQEWLNTRIFPFEAELDSNSVYWGTMLGIAESFKYGIVSTSDMYYFCDDMLRAYIESGAKVNIARALTNFDNDDIYNKENFIEARTLFEEFDGEADGRIKVDMSLHAEYTSTPEFAQTLAEYTKSVGARMHIHVSETQKEHEECKQRHNGKTPSEYLDSVGLFDVKCLAAHCVWVEDKDIEIFRRKGVTVASCPVSNMKLASGICDVAKLIDNGVSVSIGTDSVASNNNLNYFEEIKNFALGAKAKHLDPTKITPTDAFLSATRKGAEAQNRDDAGYIKEGYKADLIVIDINAPNMRPIHDLKTNLVYSASPENILLTMVDGEIMYKDGDYLSIDIEKVIHEVEKATKKILAKL